VAEPPKSCSEDGGSRDTVGLIEGPAGGEDRGERRVRYYCYYCIMEYIRRGEERREGERRGNIHRINN
jgi:hypothetical protein